MSTKQIQYKLLRKFGEDLIREVQISQIQEKEMADQMSHIQKNSR